MYAVCKVNVPVVSSSGSGVAVTTTVSCSMTVSFSTTVSFSMTVSFSVTTRVTSSLPQAARIRLATITSDSSAYSFLVNISSS